MTAWKNNSTLDVREVIAFAVRHFGRTRGWQLAARHLAISERTARGLTYEETSGATINPDTIETALMALRRERAAMLRAELNALEAECGNSFTSLAGSEIGSGMRPNGAATRRTT